VSVTVNGTLAPLYFVSPSQLNIQIPYSVPTAQGAVAAMLTVSSNGKSASADIPITNVSPGIFVDYTTGAPFGLQTAQRGQTVAIYVTGAGIVSPSVTTGSTPSGNTTPVPTTPVTISVGGVSASTAYAYLGVPVWAIGLIQINFKVPASAPLGSQPVLVMIDGTVSAAANTLVTQ
jgi:adhesin/invasin